MNSEELMFQQYKLFVENKENFINRSFHTNKFYMVLVLVIILGMFFTKEFSFAYGLTSTLIFSAAGMGICALWWLNMDAYNFLIKVKLSKVVEEMEKSLPAQPYTQEFLAIKEMKKNKKEFVFTDIQKGLSIIVFLFFFILLGNEIVLLILG